MTTLWIDADACPRSIRDIIVRGATRQALTACFVANHALPLPRSPYIRQLSVPGGADAADQQIIERLAPGDLVITSDLPLAQEAIAGGARVMTSRGETLDADNIRARLNMRDFMETLRASGEHTGGPAALTSRDIREFANAFDRTLTQLSR
ncbi:YaiI/YqxD family protein [Kushneria sinocarnis]|uniref:YaiI/YqxD family protein n=1 Tax=Kushneria sinocarnis TaxID=595502 RepID=UPI001FE4BD6F|nr:YaiI/YqxD family protein [Kushneria sinocarnis]